MRRLELSSFALGLVVGLLLGFVLVVVIGFPL